MSNAFTCTHCGAPLTAPQDPQALSMPCGYCRRENALPAHVLQYRLQEAEHRRRDAAQAGAVHQQEQAQKRGSRLVMWIMILTIVPVLIGVAVPVIIALTAVSAVSDMHFEIPAPPRPIQAPEPAARPASAAVKPRSPPKDPAVSAARIKAIMTEKDKAGCTVTTAAQRLHGHGDGEITITAVGGCSNLLLVSSADDSKITLKLTNPLGDALPVPPPATEIDFQYCAPKVGPYPFTLEPETDAPYMISLLHCPKPAAAPPPAKKK